VEIAYFDRGPIDVEDLAAELEVLTAGLGGTGKDPLTKKRQTALGETLQGIAARLR
jgi:hypothetical protein